MNALEAVVVMALIVLPFHLAIQFQFDRLADPRHIRSKGVVIVRPGALQGHGEAIGSYSGCDIWASVTFMGMEYRFERIVKPAYAGRIGARELYLEPGLLYRTD